MYNTQEIAGKIKAQAKIRNTSISELLKKCNLNINAISEFSKGKQMSLISFAKIADCLECSVDFLLGREQQETNGKNIDEQRLIEEYRSVTDEGKKAIMKQVMYISNDEQYKKYTDVPKEA